VASLACDLAAGSRFRRWVLEIMSPAVLESMQATTAPLASAGVKFNFAPPEGPAFFAPHGWRPIGVHNVLKWGIGLNRTPMDPRAHELLSELPQSGHSFPWLGVCLFQNTTSASAAE